MASHRLQSLIITGLAGLVLASSACTRSLSTPPALPSMAGDPASVTGQQATMEAVRSALLTQTAQAFDGAAFQTAVAAETTPFATAIPGGPTSVSPANSGSPSTVALNTPVPTPTPVGSTEYTVEKGDYIYSIGRKFLVDPKAIIEANNLTAPYKLEVGDVLLIPPPDNAAVGGEEYLIQGGDTVYSIARKFDVEPQAIIDANNLTAPYAIFPGDRLIIP